MPRLRAKVWIMSGISGPRMLVSSEIAKKIRKTSATIG